MDTCRYKYSGIWVKSHLRLFSSFLYYIYLHMRNKTLCRPNILLTTYNYIYNMYAVLITFFFFFLFIKYSEYNNIWWLPENHTYIHTGRYSKHGGKKKVAKKKNSYDFFLPLFYQRCRRRGCFIKFKMPFASFIMVLLLILKKRKKKSTLHTYNCESSIFSTLLNSLIYSMLDIKEREDYLWFFSFLWL